MSACCVLQALSFAHVRLIDHQHFGCWGTCFYSVCVCLCAYDFVLSLEVTLQKRSEGPMWPELVMGDRRGEYVMSDEQAALIHERLTYLTSEDLVNWLSTKTQLKTVWLFVPTLKQISRFPWKYTKLCWGAELCPELCIMKCRASVPDGCIIAARRFYSFYSTTWEFVYKADILSHGAKEKARVALKIYF